jgi:hypothetical protein
MAKKEAQKKPKAKEKKIASAPVPAHEKPFDFGGLPDRNLKKNLGCG